MERGRDLPSHKHDVAPPWIANVDWKNSRGYVNLSWDAISSAAEFDSDKLDRACETQLHKHYRQRHIGEADGDGFLPPRQIAG